MTSEIKMQILAFLGHFGLFWACYDLCISVQSFQWVYLSYFWLDTVSFTKKNSNNCEFWDENVNFGHFRPFLACFWPVEAQQLFLKLS